MQRFGSPLALLGLFGMLGCTGAEPSVPVAPLPDGWVSTILETPDQVLALFDADTEGWAALHRGDLTRALNATEPDLAARAHQELYDTRQHLLSLLRTTAPELARSWAAHTLPSGTALHTWAALVAVDADVDPTPLLALAPPPADSDWAHVHAALGSDLPEEARFAVVADRAAGTVGDCLRAHLAVRQSNSTALASLDQACSEPFLQEAGGTRAFPDPLRLHTWILVHPTPSPPVAPLAATVFSASWSPGDQASPATGPTATALGLGLASSPDEALRQVQSATETLDRWEQAGPWPGATLAADLDAFALYRTRLITAWAEEAAEPAITAEALRAIRDTNAGRTIGPTRPPSLLALEATVSVQTGHIRAALPALQALSPLNPILPELPALTEVVNDLQVASTLGRSGDSKEP